LIVSCLRLGEVRGFHEVGGSKIHVMIAIVLVPPKGPVLP